ARSRRPSHIGGRAVASPDRRMPVHPRGRCARGPRRARLGHMERNAAVTVEHLRMTYGTTVAVDDVSLTVAEGEVFGILGPNGAGKTPAAESVAGLRVPASGTIRVHGLGPVREHDALTRVLGVQLQESRLQPKITVREALV